MNVLAIDTATECCSAALLIDGEMQSISEVIPTGHSRRILAMVNQLLNQREVSLQQLDGVSVDIGPGSFTGLRIGIGVAQGLAFAANLPVVGISSLAALAAPFSGARVIPAIDARMSQVYWGLFDVEEIVTERIAPGVNDPAQVISEIAEFLQTNTIGSNNIFAVGTGWDTYQNALAKVADYAKLDVVADRFPQADWVARLASQQFKSAFGSPMNLSAAYVRNNIAQRTPIATEPSQYSG